MTPTTNDSYEFSWDLAGIGDAARNDLSIKAQLTDELGLSLTSSDTPITVLNHVPLSLMGERYLVYIMLGIVVLLIVVLIIMWRRMGNLAMRGAEVISNIE